MIVRVLPDGTRVYSGSEKYKPVAPEDRKYGVRRPDHPDAVRFHALWFEPLPVLPDQERSMPETRTDEDAIHHRMLCECHVCTREGSDGWLLMKKRRARGVR